MRIWASANDLPYKIGDGKTGMLSYFRRIQGKALPFSRPRFFAGLFAILCILFPDFARAGEINAPESALFGKVIRAISFSADLPLDDSHYLPYIGIKPGDLLTRTGVKGTIQFLYGTGRFAQISVDAAPQADGVNLQFTLRCNYYFNKFSVHGDVDLRGRSLAEWVTLPVGQRFTNERLEEARQTVLKLIMDRGFYLAQVAAQTVLDEKTRQVDTVFEVQPGRLAVIRELAVVGIGSASSKELLHRFGFREGEEFDRRLLNSRLENLRKYFVKEGYLAAVAHVKESFQKESNSVELALVISNFGKIRVAVEGFKIEKNQLRRLLPVLTGEGTDQDILEEGVNNLKDFLENQGYPEAEVNINETADASGVRVFHYVITPSHKFTVTYIHFKGNRAISNKELLASLQIQPATLLQSAAYSAEHLDEDVDSLKALYESRGYLEAKIVPLVEPVKDNKLGITYTFDEGRLSRIGSLSITGNSALTTKELLSKISIVPGKPYSPSIVERERQTLLFVYNDLGYLQAQVLVKSGTPDSQNTYPVEFKIEEGTQSVVDHILVLGNEHTRPSAIDKKIHLKESEPLSLGKLLQTQQALYGMGIFDQVRVTPQNAESMEHFQDVVVRLQEAKRYTIRYGFGYQEREKLRGTVELTDLNVFGSGRRADLRLRGSSVEQEAILSFQQPQIRPLPVDTYLTFSALQKQDVSFDSTRFNLSYQYSHPFGGHSWGMLRYNFDNVRIFNLQVSESEIGREDTPRNLSTFSVAFVNDTRDNFLDPSKGFFSSTDFGVTTKLLGSNDYVSFFTQNSYFRPIPGSLQLAVSVRFGAAHPYGGDQALPISERFFAGGGSSLRGFDTDYAGPLDPTTNKPLGGNALAIGSMEIRIPFFRSIHLAGFYDTGNVFATISDFQLSGFSHTVGLGLRIKTPFGPLRADYGINLSLSPEQRNNQGLSRNHFFITVGPPF
jgi:outer membrane protein insertion porin family